MPRTHARRVSDAYADTRIREKIATMPAKPREALAQIADELKAAGLAPSARLHYVSAITDLGKLADASREARLQRVAPPLPLREPGFPTGPNDLSYKD